MAFILSHRTSIISFFRPPSPSLNLSERRIVNIINIQPPEVNILDLGSDTRKLTKHTINLDIHIFSNVNVVGNGHLLPFKNQTFDVVICQAVLEHVRQPSVVIKEIQRVLRLNGTIYVEIPFLQGYHADPTDYYRFTIQGIEELLMPFQKIEVGICVGPMSTFCWWIRKIPTIFFKNKNFIKFIEFIMGWLTFWLKYFDYILSKAKNAHIISAGFYFWGVKVDRCE